MQHDQGPPFGAAFLLGAIVAAVTRSSAKLP